jgi:Protein of unknown function (DUF1593)
MIRLPLVACLGIALGSISAQAATFAPAPERKPKPRVIVLTDLSNEPDDEMSLVRFLLYSNEFDVEGLVATTSIHLRENPRLDIMQKFIETYGQVRDNLLVHAAGWPTAKQLLDVSKLGNTGYGLAAVGDGKSSDGSRLIIEAAERQDTRPLWIAVWGGANTLAQALDDAGKSRSKAKMDALIAKLRVYTISDQDDSGAYLRKTYPNLFFIASPKAINADEYQYSTWSGIGGDRWYRNGPGVDFELVDNPWLDENIRKNHGPLAALYPRVEYIMEGDTPSFLNLINNGLGGHEDPTWGGWGGRYTLRHTFTEPRPYFTNSRDTVNLSWPGMKKLPKGAPAFLLQHTSQQATVWRWRRAFQHDFAARVDWSATSDWKAANHNPVAIVNGDASKDAIKLSVKQGDTVTLSAEGSSDPDGQRLGYRWFAYPEAGTIDVKETEPLVLKGDKTRKLTFVAPKAITKRKPGEGTVHVILELTDSGKPQLYSYRRVILTVQP